MAQASSDPRTWNVADVSKFLESLELTSVVPTFKENAVNGKDLISFSDEDFEEDLGLSHLQIKKIRQNLPESGKTAPSTPPESLPQPRVLPSDPFIPSETPAEVVSKPEAPSHTPLTAADLDRYHQLTTRIQELQSQHVEERVRAEEAHLHGYMSSQQSYQTQIPELSAAVAKEAKRLAKYTDKWYPGKKLLGKEHHEEKLAEQSKDLQEAQAKEAEAKGKVDDLGKKIQEKLKEVSDLHQQVQELQSLRAQEAQLVERLFRGRGTAGDETEDRLEDELASFAPRQVEVRGFLTAYGQGAALMSSANDQLKGAMEQLQRALNMGRWDMISDMRPGMGSGIGGGGLMADIMKRQAFATAKALIEAAVPSLIKARQILPNLPYVELKQVKQLGLAFVDIAFDNILVDMAVQRKIRETMQSIDTMQREVEQALRWAADWHASITNDLRRLDGEYAAKGNELNVYRRKMLDDALKAPSPSLI